MQLGEDRGVHNVALIAHFVCACTDKMRVGQRTSLTSSSACCTSVACSVRAFITATCVCINSAHSPTHASLLLLSLDERDPKDSQRAPFVMRTNAQRNTGTSDAPSVATPPRVSFSLHFSLCLHVQTSSSVRFAIERVSTTPTLTIAAPLQHDIAGSYRPT